LLGEYSVSTPFNVFDLTMFDVGDESRSNPFEERGDDVDQPNTNAIILFDSFTHIYLVFFLYTHTHTHTHTHT